MLDPGQLRRQRLVSHVHVRDPGGQRGDLQILRRDPLGLHPDQHDQLVAGHLRRDTHPVITASRGARTTPTRQVTPVTSAPPVTGRDPAGHDQHTPLTG